MKSLWNKFGLAILLISAYSLGFWQSWLFDEHPNMHRAGILVMGICGMIGIGYLAGQFAKE